MPTKYYFDNAATTPVREEVSRRFFLTSENITAMHPTLQHCEGKQKGTGGSKGKGSGCDWCDTR